MNQITGIEGLDEVLNRLTAAKDRDEHDSIMGGLAAIAPQYAKEINQLYDTDAYHRFPLVWCLVGQTSSDAMEIFAKAIRDKDQYTRWAAAEALAKLKTPEASGLLVDALKDRSHLVKATAVRSMSKFRNPDAIPQLEKISASKYLRKNAPGITRDAKTALKACRNAR